MDLGIWSRYWRKEYSYEVNFSGPCAVVIGSEGRGISKLTLKNVTNLLKYLW